MAQQVKLEDSNMANYGSEEHKEMRKEAAQKEKAWEKAGDEVGLQIWRIEKFKVKHWPKDQYGEFYSGDSYIILNTMQDDEGKKSYDVHFWLGSDTTQDEAGTAAYKTVELDDLLGDEPVQYREVQGNETKKFLDLFDEIRILAGGVESGFRAVKAKEYKPRLLHITGYKKNVQVYQKPIKIESLNNSDSFVLDCGLTIFQFNGLKAGAWEKRKAQNVVASLKNSRHGKVKETYIIDGIADDASPLIEEFWSHFGGRPNEIAEEEKLEDVTKDLEHSLQHISNATGVMEINEVGKGQLDKSMLKSDDVFILDAGTQLFIWNGNGSNKAEKREAFHYASKYLKDQGRSDRLPMVSVTEGKEPAEFWAALSGQACGGRSHNAKSWKK